MSHPIRAYAATQAGGTLTPFSYDAGVLPEDFVEIEVAYCGLCHSDVSMLDNEWRNTAYPFVPGHEMVGTVVAMGAQVKGLKLGQRVGQGWLASSCQHCQPCVSGDLHLCGNKQASIVGRHGGFAERVRCHWRWAIPLPENMDIAKAGPLFCGGITVFSPLLAFGVKPTDRVGVVGIGGLGHMAIQFLNKWGCEVTAFSSNVAKRDEVLKMGAHRVVSSTDKAALKQIAGQLDFILVTVNVPLEWGAYVSALAPHGRLHIVGAVLEPVSVGVFHLMGGQKSLSSSPTGNPSTMAKMLDFCARHDIAPQVEVFPMSQVNAAIAHLREGKARYRVVLKADF